MKDRPMPAKIPTAVNIPVEQVKDLLTELLRKGGYIPATHKVLALYLGAVSAGHSVYIKATITETEKPLGIERIYEEASPVPQPRTWTTEDK